MTILVKMIFGSDLYGTRTEQSDADYRGVFMPAVRDILLGKVPKSLNQSTGPRRAKNEPGDRDDDLYSLHYFVHLACEGQTVALDMLHAPEPFWLESGPIWRDLVSKRNLFYTRGLQAFVGYARRQAAKYGVKGSRLQEVEAVREWLFGILNPEPEDVEAGRRIERIEVGQVMRLADVWDEVPLGEHVQKGTGGNDEPLLHVAGKKFGAVAPLGEVYRSVFQFAKRYGKRAQEARENKGIDWKAISHALRAAYQVQELLRDRTITFPRPEAELLAKVKRGELDYLTQAGPLLETAMAECERLSVESTLPERVNREFWQDWLAAQVAAHLRLGSETWSTP